MSDLRRQLVELAKSEASQYGEAKAKSVIGKLMGKYPEFRSSSKEVMAIIDEVIVEAIRIDKSSPFSFSNVDKKDLELKTTSISTNSLSEFSFDKSLYYF